MAFTIIAHRGHQGRAPELTLDAFQAAVDEGFCHIELDVQLSADGICVVLHDEQLGRTIAGTGRVAEHTWSQLKEMDAGSWWSPDSSAWSHCRVPSLEAVLHALRGKAHLHLVMPAPCTPRHARLYPS
ncbi:PLC-like phosphodiesterase [Haematococcus lacustris]